MKDYVQLGPTGLAIRIFRNKKAAVLFQLRPSHGLDQPVIRQMERAVAVEQIRRQVFERDDYTCVRCGKTLTWETAEMHEKQARGNCQQVGKYEYQSGEQSVENCETLCHECHTGKGGVQDRSPSFTRTNAEMSPRSL